MLYKTLITAYANTLAGKFDHSNNDIIPQGLAQIDAAAIGRMANFRSQALSRLQRSRPFFLDPKAAGYVATFREDLIERGSDLIGEIELPAEICFVEYDARSLADFCEQAWDVEVEDKDQLGRRGILVDNSEADFLRIQTFKSADNGVLIDPFADHLFKKDSAGRITGEVRCKPNDHVLQFAEFALGADYDELQRMMDETMEGDQESYATAYGLFALLASQTNDIETTVSETFTPKERKTAKKFGKRHILDAPEQFATIVLGEPGKRYMHQLEEDREDRRAIAEGRKPPVRHKVREHVRRYKSGKVVVVKSFERGHEEDRRPTRVTAVSDEEPSTLEP